MLQPSNLPIRRKVNLEKADDRQAAARKIKAEAEQLKRFFHKVAGDMADFDSPFDALALLAEVLGTDEEMLALDIGTLVKRYSDVTHDQVLCLLLLRGDLPKGEARLTAQEFVPEQQQGRSQSHQAKSIFSQVAVSANLNPFEKGKEAAASLNPFHKD